MANFSGGGLIAPTGMNQYAQAFQQGMASGQKNLAKQQYAQKFKEITGVDSTGNEKLDAEIYQKTELRNQQQQFIQNAPPGTRVQSLAGLGSYYDPSAATVGNTLKSMTFDYNKKKTEASDLFAYNERIKGQIKDATKLAIDQVNKNTKLTDSEKEVLIGKINEDAFARYSGLGDNLGNYDKGAYSIEHAKETANSYTPPPGYLTSWTGDNISPTTQPAGGVVTGGATKPTNKPQYEVGKTYAFKDKSGNTIHKTYTAKGWQ